MVEQEITDQLKETLEVLARDEDARDSARWFDTAPKRVVTYEQVGMLTGNSGLVVTMEDGSEFQITIVQSA